ncbi:MAG TPA: alanine racemase [Tepidisphaeraceae bacterium]|jgi:alanine racemase|nr:alanine racemase [Tepidisphaeraceae bacterium]
MDATSTVGLPRALISRDAILHNLKIIRGALAPGVKVCAMIKADAYGHGARILADTLTNFSFEGHEGPAADALAVATLDEAWGLGPVAAPIHVLRPVENVYIGRERQRLEMAAREGWILTVGSVEAASDLARIALACQKRLAVQIMLDTGFGREGMAVAGLDELVRAIEAFPSLRLAGLCTHFASAEEPGNLLTADQLRRFRTATDPHVARNPKLIRHAANSAAVFFSPQSHLDMVRPGISVYGIDPRGAPSMDRPLRPVMKWIAPLLLIRDVAKGVGIGYGQTWTSPRDTRVGLVPVGYGDGYLRAFSNRGKMIAHGKMVPVVGRVSMDYTMIDLGDVPAARVGDEVIVLDSDPLSRVNAYALAEWGGTVAYEILCRIGQRIPRVAVEPAENERGTIPFAGGQVA